MKQLTIKDLKRFVDEQMKKGNGDKFIVISDDNEGNGYHGLFYQFTDDVEDIKMLGNMIYDSVEDDPTKIVILG